MGYKRFLKRFWILPSHQKCGLQTYSPICSVVLTPFVIPPAFSFDIPLFICFCYCSLSFCCNSQKIISKVNVKELCLMFSSISFIFWGHIIRYFTYFDLIFMYDIQGSNFTFICENLVFPALFYEEIIHFPYSVPLLKNSSPHTFRFISVFLLHWSTFVFPCKTTLF